MLIAIDFDGTCVTHEFPNVGKDIGAVKVLKRLIASGHQLILSTVRGPISGLQEAVDWFKENDIPLYGINENPDQKSWTDSPKVLAKMYIGDDALGCPIIVTEVSDRPYVDWPTIEEWLEDAGFFTDQKTNL